jgi:hypothetical protein
MGFEKGNMEKAGKLKGGDFCECQGLEKGGHTQRAYI